MKISKLLIILIPLVLLAGCKQGSGSSSPTAGSLDSYASLGIVSDGSSGSSGSSGNPAHLVPNPEPATLALLGIGLAGLAIATLKKRKK